jgi:hypothetical protein
MMPATVDIERPRTEISQDYLQNRFNSLSQGRQGPKIKAAQLFAGLLMESMETAKGGTSYKLTSTDHMNTMLESALAQSLTDSDWVVRTHSIAAIAELPLDYKLTSAVAAGLNDQHWPARMMAVWLLAQKQGYNFAKVLDHTAQYDDRDFVRNMAIAFGAKTAPPKQYLEQPPILDLLKRDTNADSNDIFALPQTK